MVVLLGSFETRTQAEDAIAALKGSGFDEGDFSLISNAARPVGAPVDDDQRANTQVDLAVVGGAIGAVLGGALLGPIGAVLGGVAAGGGLAAALGPHGVSDEEAEAYERRLHAGRYVLAVRIDGTERSGEVRRAMTAAGADRIEQRPS